MVFSTFVLSRLSLLDITTLILILLIRLICLGFLLGILLGILLGVPLDILLGVLLDIYLSFLLGVLLFLLVSLFYLISLIGRILSLLLCIILRWIRLLVSFHVICQYYLGFRYCFLFTYLAVSIRLGVQGLLSWLVGWESCLTFGDCEVISFGTFGISGETIDCFSSRFSSYWLFFGFEDDIFVVSIYFLILMGWKVECIS